jgi:hypothetical protein
MAYLSKLFRQYFFTTVLILLTVTILTLPLATSYNLAEELWGALRPFEYWQIDEILLATFVALIVALIVSFKQIASLANEVEQLKTSKSGVRPDDGRSGSHTQYVAKCALCSKYQLGDDLWLGGDEYITQRLHATVIASVCPDCEK